MNNNQPHNKNNDNIDIVSFDRRKRAAEIIKNEEAEREKRRLQQLRQQKIERMKRARIARIKGYIMLGLTAIGALCIVIGIITLLVKVISSGNDRNNTITMSNAVSEEETQLIEIFNGHTGVVFTGKENAFLSSAGKMIENLSVSGTSANIPAVSKYISEYGALSERYMYMKDDANYSAFREAVKNAPIFSNGYVWCETDSMKSSLTDGYLYDTNTSYILAVSNICLAEGSTAFLNETDTDTQPKRDSSKGLTVAKKLEMAINYLFDNNTIDGGIKYDAQYTSLCYIHTEANSGSSTGKPSNRWTNFKFGYLDAYCNISFNRAMRALVKLYNLQGLGDEANKYKAVADQNANAFAEKFWDKDKQRFVGCFDKNGTPYDYGFVFINLEAVAAGMATDEQEKQIFSWLDGTRVIESDTSTGTDIYFFGFAPRNTTLSADDKLWDTLGGSVILAGNGGYGLYYQNGGASLSTSYYDICARYNSGNKLSAESKLQALVNEYNASGFANSDETKRIDISGNALSGLAPVAVLKTVFGIDTDGLHLTVNPDLSIIPTSSEEKITVKSLNGLGIKNISFRGNTYNFLYKDGTLYITSKLHHAVRINAGGFEPGKKYQLLKVKDGIFSNESTELVADENGIIAITTDFGSGIYVKIEEVKNK